MGSTLTHGDASLPNESNAELTSPTLAKLVDEIAELHPLPTVATSILQLTEHDRFSAHELASAITADQPSPPNCCDWRTPPTTASLAKSAPSARS
jgi:hypothetical protein